MFLFLLKLWKMTFEQKYLNPLFPLVVFFFSLTLSAEIVFIFLIDIRNNERVCLCAGMFECSSLV